MGERLGCSAETEMLPPSSPSPLFFHLLAKSCIFFFSSDEPHNYPSVPELGLQERPAASVKLAAERYFQAGSVAGSGANPWLCLSSWELHPSHAAVYSNTDLCHGQGEHWASVGANIYRPLRSSPGKREAEREWRRNPGWTEGNFISGFCELSNIK